MAPDEVMVYTGMAIVPAVASIVCFAALRAVSREAISVLISCVMFVAAVVAGMFLSFAFVSAFSHLLHGDGVLAIIAAPITGAILTIPVALIFFVWLTVIVSKRSHPRSDQT